MISGSIQNEFSGWKFPPLFLTASKYWCHFLNWTEIATIKMIWWPMSLQCNWNVCVCFAFSSFHKIHAMRKSGSSGQKNDDRRIYTSARRVCLAKRFALSFMLFTISMQRYAGAAIAANKSVMHMLVAIRIGLFTLFFLT